MMKTGRRLQWKNEDLLIVSGQLRYPINFRPLFKPKSPAPEAVKVRVFLFSPFDTYTCELGYNRAPDCTDKQISSIESQISRSAPSILIEM
jgi:hypothetical protein